MTEQTYNPSATLALYADGPAQLEAVLMGLTDRLESCPVHDSSTIRKIVHHLADSNDMETSSQAAIQSSARACSAYSGIDTTQTEMGRSWKLCEPSVSTIPGAPWRESRSHCNSYNKHDASKKIRSSEMAGW